MYIEMSVLLDDSSSDEKDVLLVIIARQTFDASQGIVFEPAIEGLIVSPLPAPMGGKRTYCRAGCFTGLKEKEFRDKEFESFVRDTVTLL